MGYYPRTATEAAQFIASPRHFASLAPTSSKAVRPRCFVVGPSRSGRTSVARKIAADLRATLVDVQDILVKIMQNGCALGEQIAPHLRAGEVVPDELCVRALARALGGLACVRDGWVVDGFPTSMAQVHML